MTDEEGGAQRGDRDGSEVGSRRGPDWSRWGEIDALFDSLLDRPPGEWEAALAAAAPDPAVRASVLRLLQATRDPGPSFSGPSEEVARAALREVAETRMPDRVGPFRPLAELGSGGMGTVYLGERVEGDFRQRVALKILRRGLDTDHLLARFRAERRILAALRHPHVAGLVDGGALPDGRPWLAMEFVDGVPLTTYCQGRGLGVRERAELVRGVALAVREAHRNLVVHRDIKPSNVLVTEEGVPKLLDFGIAKLLEAGEAGEDLTQVGSRVLTPRYAAPEQHSGDPITTATDVYQLGLLLTEAVTGQAPTPGSSGGSGMSGDLARIAAMAAHPDPLRRYRDAGALAEDLDRWLAGRPVAARPDSVLYRSTRFLQRHRWVTPTAAAMVLLLSGWGVSLARSAEALRGERDRAEAEARQAALERDRALQVTAFLQELFRAADPRGGERGDTLTARTLLFRGAERVRGDEGLDPVVRATLASTLGETAFMLGLMGEADDWMDEAVVLAEGARSPVSEEVAGILHQQARFLLSQRDFQGAVERGGRVLAIRRALVDTPPELLAQTLHTLSVALAEMGDPRSLESARELAREELALVEHAQGDATGLDLLFLNQLGYLARRAGADEEAERVYRRVLEARRGRPDSNDADLAATLNNLGQLLKGQGRLEEAEPLLREALERMRVVMEPADRNLSVAATNLAGLLHEMGRMVEAEALLREELARQRAVLPSPHWRIGSSAGSVALLLERAGRLEEAVGFREEQVEEYGGALGTVHSWTVEARLELARDLMGIRRFADAEAELHEALASVDEVDEIPDAGGLREAVREAMAVLARQSGGRFGTPRGG